MKFVYVLEDDPRFQKEIIDAIQFIDPKIQIRLFPQLSQFVDWIRVMMAEGPAAIVKGGVLPDKVVQEPVTEEAHTLVLVISKIEFLGARQLNLLRRSQKLFIERNICTKEDPTSMVLTAFDDPNFSIKQMGDRILNNIIFKPFDRLILVQHLTFAIDGRHPPSKYTIQNQKTSAVIEMLKEAPIEALSDIGFVTCSNRPIEVGKVAKYYGTPFVTDRDKSIIGVADKCEAHPTRPDEFQISVRLFAADTNQISNIRRRVRYPKASSFDYQWEIPTVPTEQINVIVVDPEEEADGGIGAALEKRFQGVKATVYDTFKTFMLEMDPSKINARDENLPKCFSLTPDMTFEFDPTGTSIVGFEKANNNPIDIFGIPETEIVGKLGWINKNLDPVHYEKLRKLVRAGALEAGEDLWFMWSVNSVRYLTKFATHTKKQNGNILIKLVEANKSDWQEYLTKTSKFPSPVHAIFFSHRFLSESPEERWTSILDLLKKRGSTSTRLFLLAAKDYSDEDQRKMARYINDIFFVPVDRSYLAQKFRYLIGVEAVTTDPVEMKTISDVGVLKVAHPVRVTEMSEAGFIMEYYRPISVGSFREMVLWQPYEIGAPELMANCNFTEPAAGQKDLFLCHFVFFGSTDHFLKGIRVWIRDNYVLSKDGNE